MIKNVVPENQTVISNIFRDSTDSSNHVEDKEKLRRTLDTTLNWKVFTKIKIE